MFTEFIDPVTIPDFVLYSKISQSSDVIVDLNGTFKESKVNVFKPTFEILWVPFKLLSTKIISE